MVAFAASVALAASTGVATAPPTARAADPPLLIAFVDKESVGGTCSDRRSSAQAARLGTPWCSMSRAVSAAKPGSTILLRKGTYPQLDVSGGERKRFITVRPYRSAKVRLEGLRTEHTSLVRVRGMRITGPVLLGESSRRIELVGNDISPSGITVRAGSRDILIERNRIHDLAYRPGNLNDGYGLLLAGGGGGIRNVKVRGNRIAGIPVDGIQATSAERLLIEHNNISRVRKLPGSGAHADSIQLIGGSRITIRSNFIHDTARGLIDTNAQVRALTLVNNLFVRMNRGFGMQLGDVRGARIVNNTEWQTRYGLAVGKAASGVTLMNNIIDTLQAGRSRLTYEDRNLIGSGNRYGRHDLKGAPGFVRPGRSDYRLRRESRAIDAGKRKGAPKRDQRGRRRGGPPDLGALESKRRAKRR